MVRFGAAEPAVLTAFGLGKRYGIGRPRVRPLLRRLAGRGPTRDGVAFGHWAVRGVSFELPRGGSLGLIGRNGSGKSTLLRLLAGTAHPTEGSVEVGARLGCLLDLGTGFQALETGRENAEGWLVLQGGLSRAEARRATRDVERFADIGDYFDRPLRTCSSGMQLRVAFATAAQLEPEVLVTDEVLAVGDDSFQRRCNRWFDRFLARGGTLVLCSHDLFQVQRLCERTLWLDAGEPRELGSTREVVRHYRELVGSAPTGGGEAGEADAGTRHRPGEASGLEFEVADMRLLDARGHDVREIDPGDTVMLVADVRAAAAIPNVHLSFTRSDGVPVYGISSDMENVLPTPVGEDLHRFVLEFPDLPLLPGNYVAKSHALDETGTRLYDTVEIAFRVRGEATGRGLVDPRPFLADAEVGRPDPGGTR
ncbi:MAG: ABC transporter ATP-binding protein [Alphaproteobacteria bacterium]